jgi:hypothetical protein
MRTRRITLPSVICPSLQYCCTLSHKRKDFIENLLNTKMCILIFSTTLVWNISYSKKKWARCDQKIYIDLHVKCLVFLPYFNDTRIFSTDFLKIFKYQISWKSIQWELSCSIRTDGRTNGQTDMTKVIIVLRNLANAPKTYIRGLSRK